MHRLSSVVVIALGALVATSSETQAQFGFYRGCRPGGYGYYRGPAFYGYSPFGPPAVGFSGISIGGFTAGVATVGPGYYAPPPYAPYPVGYTYIPAAPMPIQAHPVIVGQNPFDNPVLREWQPQEQRPNFDQNQPPVGQAPAPQPQLAQPQFGQPQLQQQFGQQQFGQPQLAQPAEPQQIPEVQIPVRPSNAEGRRKALRALAQGDEAFHMQRWAQAFSKYKEAATFAGDQADPHFRMGVTLAAMRQFGAASDAFKRGLQIDFEWPASAASLDDLYGDANILAKQSVLQSAIFWAKQDIRDAQRSFTIGVLLFLDRDAERATQFLQASVQLGGSRKYAQAFMNVQPVAGRAGDRRVVPADRQQPAAFPENRIPGTLPAQPSLPVQVNPPQELAPGSPQFPTLPQPPAALDNPADDTPAGPRLPAAPPPAKVAPPVKAPDTKPVAPPRPRTDGPEGLGPVMPVLPATPPDEKNTSARIPANGPRLMLPEDTPTTEVASPVPLVPLEARVEAARTVTAIPPVIRSGATIFRGSRRYEYFPRTRPVASQPPVIEDTFPR